LQEVLAYYHAPAVREKTTREDRFCPCVYYKELDKSGHIEGPLRGKRKTWCVVRDA
jgi:hypothetical protein